MALRGLAFVKLKNPSNARVFSSHVRRILSEKRQDLISILKLFHNGRVSPFC